MKVISWNINGIRAGIRKGLLDFIQNSNADIIHLQEAKIDDESYKLLELEKQLPEFYIYTHLATKRKGYSGLVTLARQKPTNVICGIGNHNFDSEGRVLILEYPNCYFLNTYFPSSSRDLSRLPYKKEFNEYFLSKIKKFNKPIIASGDFNVAHTPRDIARAKQNEGNAGYTKEERGFFTKLLGNGYTDTFRYTNPESIKYSWWLQGVSARERNIGWRIDYSIVSNELRNNILHADILTDVQGSDHCPILLNMDIT